MCSIGQLPTRSATNTHLTVAKEHGFSYTHEDFDFITPDRLGICVVDTSAKAVTFYPAISNHSPKCDETGSYCFLTDASSPLLLRHPRLRRRCPLRRQQQRSPRLLRARSLRLLPLPAAADCARNRHRNRAVAYKRSGNAEGRRQSSALPRSRALRSVYTRSETPPPAFHRSEQP